MFDRIARHEAMQGALVAGEAFTAWQDRVVQGMNTTAHRAAAELAHAANLEMLGQLEEVGQHLGVTAMVDGLNSFAVFAESPLECRPLSWVPHAPVTIDRNTTPIDGVKAIHGWAIAPKDDKPHRLAAFVALSGHQRDDAHGLPELSVTPLYRTPKGKPQPVSIEHTVTFDSRYAYRWLELQGQRAELSAPHVSTSAASTARLTEYYKAVEALGRDVDRQNPDTLLTLRLVEWEQGMIDGRPYTYREPQRKPTLAQHVQMAHEIMGYIKAHGFLPGSELLSPDALTPDRVIYESAFGLESVQALFDPGRRSHQRNWFGKKTAVAAVPAGPLAGGSIVHNSRDAQAEVQHRIGELYADAIGAS